MASSYSILHNFNQVPLYSPDYNFLSQALQYKQGSLDANRVKVQDLVNQIGLLDVYKDVDKDYRDQRMNNVLSIVNQYAGGDLSSAGLTNSIMQNVNQVLDENVKNAVYSTKLFKAEQAEWDKQRTEHPEKYLDKNRNFALTFSQPWRDSQQVGEVYQGGGGFREYSDYNSKINKAMPDLLKTLEREQRQQGNNGTFTYYDVYRSINKGQLSSALDNILSDQDKEQIKIDAWDRYKDVPDQQLNQYIKQYTGTAFDTYDDKIQKLESLKLNKTNPDEISAIDQAIAGYQQDKEETGGILTQTDRQSAYTSLFYNQWKGGYLNAYYHEPEFVKREIDQVDEATKNYSLKVQNMNFTMAKDARDYAFNQQKFQLEKDKFAFQQMKAAGSGMSSSGLKLPDIVQGNAQNTPEQNTSYAQAYIKNEESSVQGIRNLLSGYVNDGTIPEVNDEVIKQLIPAFQENVGKDKVIAKVNGKNVVFDMTNPKVFQAVNNFQKYVVEDGPERQQLYKSADNFLYKSIYELSQAVAHGGDLSAGNLPSMNFELVPDGKGNYVKQATDNNTFVNLLNKAGTYGFDKLTPAHQATLKLQMGIFATADPSLSNNQGQVANKILNQYLDRSLLNRVTNADEINRDIHTSFDLNKALTRDYSNSWSLDPTIGQIERFLGGDEITPLRKDKYFSEYGAGDTENNKTSGRGLDALYNDFQTGVTNSLENLGKQINAAPTVSNLVYYKGTQNYDAIKRAINNPILPKDATITLQPQTENGNLTGGYIATFKYGESHKGEKITKESEPYVITPAEANRLGISAVSGQRRLYDASVGEYAPSLAMGSAYVDASQKSRVFRLSQNSGGTLPFNDPRFARNASERGASNLYSSLIAEANSSNSPYTFSIDPENGIYYHTIYKNGKEIFSKPLAGVNNSTVTDILPEELYNFQTNSQLYNQNLFMQYIDDQINQQSIYNGISQ